MFVYVGTYTTPPMGRAEGLYVYRLDPASGALAPVQTVPGVVNPSFLALDPQERFLFAVNEVEQGTVSAFARDPAAGELTPLNEQPTHGAAPCHLSVDPTGRFVLVANYGSGEVAVFPVGPDGRLGAATDVVRHEGKSVHPQRQTGPHAHMIVPDPEGRHVLAADLGLDQVVVYRLDDTAGRLVPHGRFHATPGAGPRQLAFAGGGRFVYVVNELDSTLTACAYDPAAGTLRAIETVSTLPDGFAGENTCARVEVHPSGRFVYASNRGHHSIAIFAIEEATGRLTAVGHEPTGGRTPRHFALDPTGAWLLAANQGSDSIVTFRVDPATGRLAAAGPVAEAPTPVCLVFGRA